MEHSEITEPAQPFVQLQALKGITRLFYSKKFENACYALQPSVSFLPSRISKFHGKVYFFFCTHATMEFCQYFQYQLALISNAFKENLTRDK